MELKSSRYQEILDRLGAVRRKRNGLALAAGLFGWILCCLALLTVVIILEQLFAFATPGRAVLLGAAVLGAAGSFAWLALRPLLIALGVLCQTVSFTTGVPSRRICEPPG